MKQFFISLCLVVASAISVYALDAKPGQASTGYGSSAGYLAGNYGWDWGCLCNKVKYTTIEQGSKEDGTHVWAFVPKQLKNGAKAPVYIYLHGFFAVVPDIYMAHIEHLLRQGYIVVFPIFQPSRFGILNSMGIFDEANQQDWLNNAVTESVKMLDEKIGSKADLSSVYLFGHSLGGALATGFTKTMQRMGIDDLIVKGIVLANAQINPSAGMPSFVSSMVKVKPVDYADGCKSITAPTIVMSGDKDGIALLSQVSDIYRNIPASTPRAGWKVRSDDVSYWYWGLWYRGSLTADHGAPMNDAGSWLLNATLDIMGIGWVDVNTLDYRVYFAATDAIRDAVVNVPWNMGTWEKRSNGPKAPVRCDAGCQ